MNVDQEIEQHDYTGQPGCPCGGWGTHICPVPDYEESGDYVFELVTKHGTIKDRFTFYGPYSAGYELAQQRGALYDAPIIHIEVN